MTSWQLIVDGRVIPIYSPMTLLRAGVVPRVMMETLGHSQISLTMNTYCHVIPALGRAAADEMHALLGSQSGTGTG